MTSEEIGGIVPHITLKRPVAILIWRLSGG
jgi:hypothetical protein